MLFFQFGGGNAGVYAFSYATNTWSLVDSYLPTGNSWLSPFGSWDGLAGKFVISLGETPPSWYVYNPAVTGAGAWSNVTSRAPADIRGASCASGGSKPCYAAALTYDATNQRTIVLTQDTGNVLGLWAYNAVADTWQKVTTAGGSGANTATGYPNTLHYDGGTASLYLLDRAAFWSSGNAGTIRTLKIRLDLGNPLPTNTQGLATPTPRATATGTGGPTNPPVPSTPTPGGPTPTCAGTVRSVGPGRTYTKPSQAAAVVQSNDCVHIDAGTYANDVALWPSRASDITIRGINGLARMTVTNGIVYGSKGIWVFAGANTTVENVAFSCATSRTNNTNCSGILVGDGNDAGIRIEAPGLTVRNCVFHDNDNGILGGPSSGPAGDVLIEHSEFFRNGLGDGFTHNLYLNKNHKSLTFRYNYTHGAITGHNLKSRAATNYILYNRIMDETNGVTSCTDPGTCSASVEVEVPCGGLNYVIGNVIQKGPNADAVDLVKFAAELSSTACPQPSYPTQELYVINNTMVNDFGPTANFIRGFGAAPLVWAKNNIFWGGGTGINWPAGGAVVQGNNVTADPKLLSRATFDYHLTAASTAVINQGVDPGSDVRGYDLMPTRHYVYDRQSAARPVSGALDVGAYEYEAALSPFSTPTITPTNTPTVALTWTPTPVAPVYCSAGQGEAVYPIAASEDDGSVQRTGTNYAALDPGNVSTGKYDNYEDYVIRKNVNGRYVVQLVTWRWNTATRPDGSAWPSGTQIVGAFVRPYWLGQGSGSRPLALDWHDWPPPAPLSSADWTLDSVTSADPAFAATTGRSPKGRQTIALSNPATNVNLQGYTGLRLTVTGGAPPAAGEDNSVPLRPQDFVTSSGDQSAQLVLCYIQGTPQPPSAPHLY